MKQSMSIILAMLLVMSVISCAPQTKTQKGGLYGAAGGAAAGAGIGQAIGRDTQSTLWGAAIGAAVGGLAGAGAGRMMDQQEREFQEALAASRSATMKREGDLIALTLKGDVTFDHDSAKINPGFKGELDQIATILQKYPNTVIQVEGHTDSSGTETYNMALSRRRASAVKTYLTSQGVGAHRIRTVGYGETKPLASNDTQSGKQMNRRVEIKIAPSQSSS